MLVLCISMFKQVFPSFSVTNWKKVEKAKQIHFYSISLDTIDHDHAIVLNYFSEELYKMKVFCLKLSERFHHCIISTIYQVRVSYIVCDIPSRYYTCSLNWVLRFSIYSVLWSFFSVLRFSIYSVLRIRSTVPVCFRDFNFGFFLCLCPLASTLYVPLNHRNWGTV